MPKLNVAAAYCSDYAILDEDLRFLQAIGDFSIQQIIAQLAIETLAISIFPGRTGRSLSRFRRCVAPMESRRRVYIMKTNFLWLVFFVVTTTTLYSGQPLDIQLFEKHEPWPVPVPDRTGARI